MKRYIAQFIRGGFPELYAVADTEERCLVGDPKPYHEANDEAEARNAGTWAPTTFEVFDLTPAMSAWLGGLNMPGSDC